MNQRESSGFPSALAALLVAFLASSVHAQQEQSSSIDWDRSVQLGFGGAAGNSENYNVHLSADLDFRGKLWRGEIIDLTLSETVIRRDDGDDEKARESQIRYDGNLKRAFSNSRLGLALTWEFNDSHSEYGSVSEYWDAGAGLNWNVLDQGRLRFEFDSIGLTWREDELGGGDAVGDVWGRIESSLDYRLSDHASLEWESTLSVNPDDEATQESRLKSKQELKLTSSLTKMLSLVLDSVWVWDSADLSEDSGNVDGYDLTVSMGVGAKW